MAITPRQRKSGLLYFVGWLALLYLGNGLGFAQSRQQSLRRVRERVLVKRFQSVLAVWETLH